MNKEIRRKMDIVLTVSGKKETVLSLEKIAFSKTENEDVFLLKRKPYYFLTSSKRGSSRYDFTFVDDIIFEKFIEKDTDFKDREELRDYFFFQNLVPLSKIDERESEIDLEERMFEEWNFLNAGCLTNFSAYSLNNSFLYLPTKKEYQKDFRISVDTFLPIEDLENNENFQIGKSFFKKLSLKYPDLEINVRASDEYLDYLIFSNYFEGKLLNEKKFKVGYDYDDFVEELLKIEDITKLNNVLIEFEFEERDRFFNEDDEDDDDYD